MAFFVWFITARHMRDGSLECECLHYMNHGYGAAPAHDDRHPCAVDRAGAADCGMGRPMSAAPADQAVTVICAIVSR